MTDQPSTEPPSDKDAATPQPDDALPDEPLPQVATHRRAPRFGRFMLAGILLAGVAAFVAVLLTPGQSGYEPWDLFWLLMLWFGPLGMLGGALTALAIDRRSIAKAESQLGGK